MGVTHFIADLHLGDAHPETTQRFLDYCASKAREAQQLYILGDLFDAWIGDDDDALASRSVVSALAELNHAGIAIHVQHGNRDFLLGERFCDETGAKLMNEETLIDLGGESTLLLHGDQLCTDDVQYQAVRAQVRNPAWAAPLLAQPLPVRREMAAKFREQSGEATSLLANDIMDVNQDAVLDMLKKHNVKTMIHGHTHRPADHNIPELNARRIVLADWHADRGEVLINDDAQGLYRATV